MKRIKFCSLLFILFITLAHSTWAKSFTCHSFLTSPSVTVNKSIESLEDFYEAMTKNLILNKEHKGLWELYRATKFGNSGYFTDEYSLKTVLDILEKYPELEKPLFREQLLSKTTKVYETPDGLKSFIHSQVQGFGTFKSNFLHIEANHKFWRKLLGLEHFSKVQFERRLNRIFSEDLKKKLKERNTDNYLENLTLLTKELAAYRTKLLRIKLRLNTQLKTKISDNIDIRINNNNQTIKRIDQAIVDIIHMSPFFNSYLLNKFKNSGNALDKIEVFKAMLAERDQLVNLIIPHSFLYSANTYINDNLNDKKPFYMAPSLDGHFHEILQILEIKGSTFLNTKHDIDSLLSDLETLTKTQNFTIKNEKEIRIRPLSIIESPFRGCLGGTDCSTRTYFDKALDPNFIYFTMTDSENNSSGHVTLVLGTAKDEMNNEINVAFIDKIQNVPNDKIALLLEGIRRSLNEKEYTLIIPKDVGDHNGLSNESTTRDFVKSQLLVHYNKSLFNFTPHKHDYHFENKYSRAYEALEAFEVKPLEDGSELTFSNGSVFEPNSAPLDLSIETLIKPIMDLKNSSNNEDLLQYLAFADSAQSLEKYGFNINEYWQEVDDIFNSTSNDSIKKQALFSLLTNKTDQDHLLVKENFTSDLWQQLLGELPQWKNSSNTKRKETWSRISNFDFNIFNKSVDEIKAYLRTPFIDINAKDNDGKTALMWAADSHADVVKTLLELRPDIDINAKDDKGRTALMWAAANGQTDIVKTLLELRLDIDINAKNMYGRTALMWAVINGHVDVVKTLLKLRPDIDINTKDKYGRTALIFSAQNGQADVVKTLLELRPDIDINAKDDTGRTALIWAAINGHADVVKILLELRPDIDINAKDDTGRTALTTTHTTIKKLLKNFGSIE